MSQDTLRLQVSGVEEWHKASIRWLVQRMDRGTILVLSEAHHLCGVTHLTKDLGHHLSPTGSLAWYTPADHYQLCFRSNASDPFVVLWQNHQPGIRKV